MGEPAAPLRVPWTVAHLWIGTGRQGAVPRPPPEQLDLSVQTRLLGTVYHSLVVVGLAGIRGGWHRARAAGDFAGMLAAEIRAEWVLAHARAKLEAMGEPPETADAYLAAMRWRADAQGDRFIGPPWPSLRAALEARA